MAEQAYYAGWARTQFVGHGDEVDASRVEEVASRGLADAMWILQKFELEPPSRLPDGVDTRFLPAKWT